MSTAGYSVTPQPEHAPDTWTVTARDKTVNRATGEIEIRSQIIATYTSLIEALAAIPLHYAAHPVDWAAPLWESPLQTTMNKLLRAAQPDRLENTP